MKKILLAALSAVALSAGFLTSCIYDNPVDAGDGKKIVTTGSGGMPVEYNPNYGSFFNKDFITTYDMEIWAPNYVSNPRPTFSINQELGYIKADEYGWWGGRIGGYNNLAGTVYDLEELKYATLTVIIPEGVDPIELYCIMGSLLKSNGQAYGEGETEEHKVVFSNLGPGEHNLTIDKINRYWTTSPNILTLGANGANYSLIIKNVTFFDSDDQIITDFPVVSDED